MLESLIDTLFYNWLGLQEGVHWVDALHFFVYDTVKIGILLVLITLIMGTVNSYFPVERVRRFLASRNLYGGEYLISSLFGAVTPFCSCSSIPLFIGFLQGGLPVGVTFSYLITSPLVNEVALALFIGMFGWKVTLVYAVSGILLGTLLGWLINRLNMEAYVEDWVWNIAKQKTVNAQGEERKPTFKERIPGIVEEAQGIIKRIGPYVLIGIGIGGIIHGFLPTNFFQAYLTESNPFAVPVAVLVAIPMYANASGVIPIVQALVAKGIPLGTAMAFMMAVVGLSLPEALILKKVLKPRLLATFFGSVGLSIIGLGYVFNGIF